MHLRGVKTNERDHTIPPGHAAPRSRAGDATIKVDDDALTLRPDGLPLYPPLLRTTRSAEFSFRKTSFTYLVMDFIITGLTHDFKRERQKPKSAALFFTLNSTLNEYVFTFPLCCFFVLAPCHAFSCFFALVSWILFLLKKCYGRRVAVWPPAGVFTSHYGVITIFCTWIYLPFFRQFLIIFTSCGLF